jgi:hypothetical protein
MNPRYPIYIVSKGRWEKRLTSDCLEGYGVPYRMVVEPQEYDDYAARMAYPHQRLLILPQKYHDEYDPCTDLPHGSNGPGAARNFCWDHAISTGATSHWVLDDNIRAFVRLNRHRKDRVTSGSVFCAAEDFVDRYENVGLSGFNYRAFAKERQRLQPFILNTRIYSCMLIRNDLSFRWRGRYNEDTDLSLRVLKAGWCTIQFNAFLQDKIVTQSMKGGNTEAFYNAEGTRLKSEMIRDLHPDVTRLTWRFGRIHHYVNYRPFRRNKLIKKRGLVVPSGINNYGMELREKAELVE